MTMLVSGVLVWIAVHLFPALMPARRAALIGQIGEKRYKGVFTIGIAIALFLIIMGWRSAPVEPLYTPPLFGSVIVTVLMLLSFILFAAANAPGNIRRVLRHPMLTGLALWGIAHLLANGTSRDVVLFGGLAAWAVAEIILVSRRDGAWTKPAPAPLSRDVITVVAAGAVFGIVLYFHEALFGVAPIPGM